MEKISRADAEKLVRSVTRTCKGPFRPEAARRLARNLRATVREVIMAIDPTDRDLATPEIRAKAREALVALPDSEGKERALVLLDLIDRAGRVAAAKDTEGAVRLEIAALLVDGREKDADVLHHGCRLGCGADFNDVILAHPLDGETRTVKCPRCSMEVRYTAPDGLQIVGAS